MYGSANQSVKLFFGKDRRPAIVWKGDVEIGSENNERVLFAFEEVLQNYIASLIGQ